MELNNHKVVIFHGIDIEKNNKILRDIIESIKLDLDQIHITEDIAILEKNDLGINIIIDDQIIQFDFKEDVHFTVIKEFFDQLRKARELEEYVCFYICQHNRELQKENLNGLIENSLEGITLRMLGFDYQAERHIYRVSTFLKDSILRSTLRIDFEIVNYVNLEKSILGIQHELGESVIKEVYKFVGGN
ncbi:hypothetical protein [Bacillus tropicus]|uniref:hypothetical protein n=1 Tax=Bacillus tropicus TaxID=2026188 RepID=UPI003D1C6F9B